MEGNTQIKTVMKSHTVSNTLQEKYSNFQIKMALVSELLRKKSQHYIATKEVLILCSDTTPVSSPCCYNTA